MSIQDGAVVAGANRGIDGRGRPQGEDEMSAGPKIHRFTAAAFPANAYLVETPDGAILIDANLAVSDGRRIRARIDGLAKPLLGVIVTHAHPDHYGAIVEVLG